jgi:GH24 family phage-related lysozyme (muramidase)
MTKFDMDMRKIEQSVARLTGDRRGAARFRRELTAAVREAVVKAEPQIMAELIAKHVAEKTAGWVNDPDRNKAVLVQAGGTGCVLLDSKGKPILGRRITYPKTPEFDLGNLVDHLKRSDVENFVPYMYLDEKGNVTVGIGLLLETVQEAISLPFVERGPTKRAHPKHIENAYNKVKAAQRDKVWPFYKPLTHIDISLADATTLTLDFINKVLVEIRSAAVYPEFDSFPVPAKMAILDMVYTTGSGKIVTKWPRFTAAVRRRNWKQAFQEATDRVDSAGRQKQLEIWFTQAAEGKNEKFFLDPSCKPLPLTSP